MKKRNQKTIRDLNLLRILRDADHYYCVDSHSRDNLLCRGDLRDIADDLFAHEIINSDKSLTTPHNRGMNPFFLIIHPDKAREFTNMNSFRPLYAGNYYPAGEYREEWGCADQFIVLVDSRLDEYKELTKDGKTHYVSIAVGWHDDMHTKPYYIGVRSL